MEPTIIYCIINPRHVRRVTVGGLCVCLSVRLLAPASDREYEIEGFLVVDFAKPYRCITQLPFRTPLYRRRGLDVGRTSSLT